MLAKLELSDANFNNFRTEFLSAFIILLLLLLTLLSFSALLFKTIGSILVIINSIFIYYIVNYKIPVNLEMIESIFNTDKSEVLGLLNINLILWQLPALIFIVLFNYSVKISKPLPKPVLYSLLVLSLYPAYTYYELMHNREKYEKGYYRVVVSNLQNYLPLNYINNSYRYFKRSHLKNSLKNHECTIAVNFKHSHNNDLNIVLVIGESARADRFSLNGYKKSETTPTLKSIKNAISFTDAHSLGTATTTTVPKIFQKDDTGKFCLIPALRSIGFYNKWISINGSSGLLEYIGQGCNHVLSKSQIVSSEDLAREPMDGDLLKLLSSDKREGMRLTISHTKGSHDIYDHRVPESFKKFSPNCSSYPNNCINNLEALSNSYDNTILYTDYFLSEIIKQLKNENALMIYVSDHGESLGENGMFSHSHDAAFAPQETHIPMIWWASDKFLADLENRRKFSVLKNNRQKFVDQSYIFHSMLDCIGVESNEINHKKSVCSTKLN